jgi:hypothetical protein
LPLIICAVLLFVVDQASATLSAAPPLVPPSAEQPTVAIAAVTTIAPDKSDKMRGRNLPRMSPAALPGVLIAIFMPGSFSVWLVRQNRKVRPRRSRS